ALLLNTLTRIHYHLNDLAIAEALSEAAHKLAAEEPSVLNEVLASRALVLFDLGRYDEAERLWRQVVRAFEEREERVPAVYRLMNLGYCLVVQGKIEEGLERVEEAVRRSEKLKNPHLLACSLLLLGSSRFATGLKEKAAPVLQRALEVSRSEDFRDVGWAAAFYLWKI